mgnify:CR=1 FL=1
MDILDQLEEILTEVNEGVSEGSQVGRLLFNRFMTIQDPSERQSLCLLSSLLVVSILTKDKGLFSKIKGGVNHHPRNNPKNPNR